MRSPGRRRVVVIAAAVSATLPAAAIWWTGRTELRSLATAAVFTYVLPWAVAWTCAPGRRRAILLRFGASLVGMGAVWLALEVAGVARLVNYPALMRAPISDWWYGPPYNIVDDELLYIHRPYLRLSGSQPGDITATPCTASPVYRYDVHYDRHGFRNETDLEQANIAVLGDSFVEAPTIPTSMTMTSILARLTGLTVANLGLSAYGPQQELGVLKRYAAPLRPSAIVWAFYEGNDFKDMARYEQRRAHLRDAERRHIRVEASLAWNALFALQRVVRGCSTPPTQGLPSGMLPGPRPIQMQFIPPPSSPGDDEIETLASIFRDAEAQARRIDSRLLIVFVPTSFRVYHDLVDCRDCPATLDDVSGPIERMLRTVSPDIDYLDLTGPLREAARGGRLVYRPDDTHWTDAGHQVVAEAVSRVLGPAAARR